MRQSFFLDTFHTLKQGGREIYMELVQKNIHFNRISKSAKNQITVEEDVNIPDTKEDIESILFHHQKVIVDEVKTSDQKVHIRGRLLYTILYRSEESGRLCCLEGSIPIEEKLYIEDIENTDKVTVKILIEDFSVGIINSRKISIQSILNIDATVQELYDEQVTIDLKDEVCEVQKKECQFTQLSVCKKDIFRFRENIVLPNNMPNVEKILWKNISIQEFECKTLAGELVIQGKAFIFIIYEGERQNQPQIYQVTLPFNTTIECSGCECDMISDVSYDIVESQIHLESDFDGEARSFNVELVFELDIKVYTTEKVEVLWDVYGIQKEMLPVDKSVQYDILLMNESSNFKISDNIHIHEMEENVCEILYGEGECFVEKCEITENGVLIHGMIVTQMLFRQENVENEYGSYTNMYPFEHFIEFANGMQIHKEQLKSYVNLHCDTVQMQNQGEGNVEIRYGISYKLFVFETIESKNIISVEMKEMDVEKYNNLPSMAVYFAKAGDTLWEMGKKYCVPIRLIKEMNQMSSDEVKAGEKIFIVRE